MVSGEEDDFTGAVTVQPQHTLYGTTYSVSTSHIQLIDPSTLEKI